MVLGVWSMDFNNGDGINGITTLPLFLQHHMCIFSVSHSYLMICGESVYFSAVYVFHFLFNMHEFNFKTIVGKGWKDWTEGPKKSRKSRLIGFGLRILTSYQELGFSD